MILFPRMLRWLRRTKRKLWVPARELDLSRRDMLKGLVAGAIIAAAPLPVFAPEEVAIATGYSGGSSALAAFNDFVESTGPPYSIPCFVNEDPNAFKGLLNAG